MQSTSIPSMQSNDGSSMPLHQSGTKEKQESIFDFSKITAYFDPARTTGQAIGRHSAGILKRLQQNDDTIYGIYSNGQIKRLAKISYAFSKARL